MCCAASSQPDVVRLLKAGDLLSTGSRINKVKFDGTVGHEHRKHVDMRCTGTCMIQEDILPRATAIQVYSASKGGTGSVELRQIDAGALSTSQGHAEFVHSTCLAWCEEGMHL